MNLNEVQLHILINFKNSHNKTCISNEFFLQYLQVKPENGTILPWSKETLKFTFNGIERVQMSIEVLCEVKGGIAQNFIINAIADIPKFKIEDKLLDYGLPVILYTFYTN